MISDPDDMSPQIRALVREYGLEKVLGIMQAFGVQDYEDIERLLEKETRAMQNKTEREIAESIKKLSG